MPLGSHEGLLCIGVSPVLASNATIDFMSRAATLTTLSFRSGGRFNRMPSRGGQSIRAVPNIGQRGRLEHPAGRKEK